MPSTTPLPWGLPGDNQLTPILVKVCLMEFYFDRQGIGEVDKNDYSLVILNTFAKKKKIKENNYLGGQLSSLSTQNPIPN